MQDEKCPSTNGAETTLEKKIKRPNSKPMEGTRSTLQCCEIERVRLTKKSHFSNTWTSS